MGGMSWFLTKGSDEYLAAVGGVLTDFLPPYAAANTILLVAAASQRRSAPGHGGDRLRRGERLSRGDGRWNVIHRHGQMVRGLPGQFVVCDMVRPQCAEHPAGHPDRVDAAPHAVRGMLVRGMMPRGRLPWRAQSRCRVVQAACPQHLSRTPVDPVPTLATGVVVPFTLVDHLPEPCRAGVGVGRLVEPPILPCGELH